MDLRTTPEMNATQAVMLAGGKGERLFPQADSRSEPKVAFGGVFRSIDFALSNCFYSGVRRLSLLTQYKHEDLEWYVRQGWSDLWSESRSDQRPIVLFPPSTGKRYRGNADAVFQNREMLLADASEYVLVLSGDHVYHMDYRDLVHRHAEKDADLTIAVVEHPLEESYRFGIVEVDADFKVIGFEEKPSNPRPIPSRPAKALVSMGVYVFGKSALLESLNECCGSESGFDFGRDVIPSLIRNGRTDAYDYRDEVRDSPCYWSGIGTIDSYDIHAA